jgi:RNA polymerase sigma-70 factor (family 1)
MLLSEKDDIDLWNAVRNDDLSAFNELFARYWSRLYKVAFQRLQDENTSLEIVHDIFLSLWTRRETLVINKIPNFLLTSVRYQLYSRQKAAKLSIAYKAELFDTSEFAEQNAGEIRIQNIEMQKQLDEYLNRLPERCQEIFLLSRMQHLTNQEISERLGISKKTVENNIAIALKYLRLAIRNTGSLMLLLLMFSIK